MYNAVRNKVSPMLISRVKRIISRVITTVFGSHFATFDYPIIVNSFGRSGSTLLTKSIIKAGTTSVWGSVQKVADIATYSWRKDLDAQELSGGLVYKTHDYPPKAFPGDNTRMIYTFSDPVDVVLSLLRIHNMRRKRGVTGRDWISIHADHLKVSFDNIEEIVNKDIFHLEDHLNAWLEEERVPIAFVRYETMWEHQEDISDFLGFEITLPPY